MILAREGFPIFYWVYCASKNAAVLLMRVKRIIFLFITSLFPPSSRTVVINVLQIRVEKGAAEIGPAIDVDDLAGHVI